MALSTAITDALLAVACGVAAVPLLRAPAPLAGRIGGYGLGLVGLAAALGALRFAGVGDVAPVHDTLSRLAGFVGVPWIGVAWATAGRPDRDARLGAGLVFVGGTIAHLAGLTAWRTGAGGLAMAAVIGVALTGLARGRPEGAAFGAGGALLTLLAGLAVGTEGAIGPMPRVDLFHVLLMLANLGLGVGLAHRLAALDDGGAPSTAP